KIEKLLAESVDAAYESLKERYRDGEAFYDEDNIRYYFYLELNARKVSRHKVTLECPCLEGEPMRGVDTRIKFPEKTVWMEFKFHRKSGKGVIAKTKKFGSILADLLRLSSLPQKNRKYSCYTVDAIMFKYFYNAGYETLISGKPFTIQRKKGEFYLGSIKLSPYTQKVIRDRTWKMPPNVKAVVRPIPLSAAKLSKKDKGFPYHVFFYRVGKK
ncbi:hypothetical protein ACFL6Y_10020, partial [Elusimicrobiota bacterium]